MQKIVEGAIHRSKLTLATLVFLLIAGFVAYSEIPKEAEPDVQVPIVYARLSLQGIAPEDAERLLLRPVETQFKSIANVKEMRSTAFEGGGYVLLEFEAGQDIKKAIADVRAKLDDSKRDLPTNMDQPTVEEVNLSLFPVLVVNLSGNVPERTLVRIAKDLKDRIQETKGVLKAELAGARDEVTEIIVDPRVLSAYGISVDQFSTFAKANNQLIAAGTLESGQGRYAVKVPALLETVRDVADLPVVAGPDGVITARDLAEIRATFKDPETLTRLDGKKAIALEVSKRLGANLIDTVDLVKKTVGTISKTWPDGITVTFTQDKSKNIRNMLADLQNSVITAVILVFIIVLWSLGGSSSLLIGLSIPASFLMGMLWLSLSGLTVNIVVLFSLILAVGMLVDDTIIVAEYADRRMAEGADPKTAYVEASTRMVGPVLAATATRVAAFSPLLFWPGIVGQFMKYMPITLIATLSASLLYALIFAPVLGAKFAKFNHDHAPSKKREGLYWWAIEQSITRPWRMVLGTLALLIFIPVVHSMLGKGVEFFPKVEPDYGLIYVHARGNLSITEKDELVKQVEARLVGKKELKSIYTRVGKVVGGQDVPEDVVGVIQFEFADWQSRKPALDVLEDIRIDTADIPGIFVEPKSPEAGPPTGKPIKIQVVSLNPENLNAAAKVIANVVRAHPAARDVDDGAQLPGIDWKISIDKAEAAKYGVTAASVGNAIKMVTNGVIISNYRPDDVTQSVDAIIRFPEDRRTLNDLDDVRVATTKGFVPISQFMKREPAPRVGQLKRINGQRQITIEANIKNEYNATAVRDEITQTLAKEKFPLGVMYGMRGQDEEQKQAGAFLIKAFGVAVFMIFAILLAQFNRFRSVGLVLSAVFMSTIGVFIGLLAMQQSFSIVMTGIGIIALAGVVVNNNIVLIDTFEHYRKAGVELTEAIRLTCAERTRPVLLTAITAILGVLPIAFAVNIDFTLREVTVGAPATQWWIQLSTAIVYGLGFATVLTLVITPAMLMLTERRKKRV